MKVGISTLGCKVNIYESEFVISKLKEANYEIVSFSDYADIYIINTCTVTNTSDVKSRKLIRQARKNNKNSIIVVMGCHSQIKYNEVDADIIIGNKDKSKIIELIEEYLKNNKKITRIYNLENISFEPMEIKKFNNHTRGFVKIQDGCDAFCSYCIIPYARGSIRSKKEEDVINEITSLVENGYQEIVLTGIHTGKYGKDINTNLYNLLANLLKINNLKRIRISSIEINEITDDILNLLKNTNIIVDHLHIPLQSGCDKILKLMNRKYNTKYFSEKIENIRKIRKDISITTDVIVGFPNENDADFKETLDFIKKIKFTKIHVFPYSKRDNTIAATMNNQVDEIIKKKRVKELINLSSELEKKYLTKFLNKDLEILTEEYKDGFTIGHTSNYIKVLVNDLLDINKIYKVKIIKILDSEVIGEII